jgi:hypothetical protein
VKPGIGYPLLGHAQPQAPSAFQLHCALWWQHPRDTGDGSRTSARAWRALLGDSQTTWLLEAWGVPARAPPLAHRALGLDICRRMG